MTATMSLGGTAPPRLPIPVLVDAGSPVEARHVVTPVDRDGRLADRSLLTFLGWSPGVEIALRVEPGPIVIARPGAGVWVDRRGHLHLPAAMRHSFGIAPGDRVLLAADQRAGELLIIPGRVLTKMIDAYRNAPGQAGAP
jgi:hypothetical protein